MQKYCKFSGYINIDLYKEQIGIEWMGLDIVAGDGKVNLLVLKLTIVQNPLKWQLHRWNLYLN